MISACMTVSVRELRTAVREWACCTGHKKYSGLKRVKEDLNYRCSRCHENARPIDRRPQKDVQVGSDKLELVASFCYMSDMLSAAEGCELAMIMHVKTVWKKFFHHPTSSTRPEVMCTAHVTGMQCFMQARLSP